MEFWNSWMNSPIIFGAIGLVIAAFFYFRVKAIPDGNETMRRIAGYIREGAMAFLNRQYKVLAVYAAVVFVAIGMSLGWMPGASFLLGAFLSLLAGFIGMRAATLANVRTTEAARTGIRANALLTALDGGAVMGIVVASLGLIGLGGVYLYFKDAENLSPILHSFAVGASSIALFARIGGGIYTKAADVGSDIAGKVIQGIPEDDPRNPGVIADNVGDNVGDVAGMGADIYESMIAAIVAAMAIAIASTAPNFPVLVNSGDATMNKIVGVGLPLLISGLGLAVSIVCIFIARAMKFLL
jgi:K(+)-stimulated pyrophosphate-energized sodium pump